ncbi:MAG: hypothetical protein KFKLKKLM_00946 [Flavobacteriales bacterium]|nr:hypothetical protein [Flavobacteriales bacterium]
MVTPVPALPVNDHALAEADKLDKGTAQLLPASVITKLSAVPFKPKLVINSFVGLASASSIPKTTELPPEMSKSIEPGDGVAVNVWLSVLSK